MPKLFNANGGKKSPLNLRTTSELRSQIESAAVKSGRSLAQEVEHRLERTFIEDRERERIHMTLYSGWPLQYPIEISEQPTWSNWACQGSGNVAAAVKGDSLGRRLLDHATGQVEIVEQLLNRPKPREDA